MKTVNAKIVPSERSSNKPLEMKPEGLPRMKTLKEVAELTGLSYTCLRNLCLQNQIVYIRAGTKYLINYDRFIDYLNGVKRA